MVIVFLSNYVNHHQVPLADVFYGMPNVSYTFIATQEMYDWRKQLGYPDFSDRPYVLNSFESKEKYDEAISLINDADVLIAGSAPECMIAPRLKRNKLTFRYSERWFKKKEWYRLGLRGLYNIYKNHYRYRDRNVYMLAASAYTSNDVSHFFLYPNKIFKWGYFTEVPDIDIDEILKNKRRDIVRIIWCARIIDWKHPELVPQLAKKLVDNGITNFEIEMIGSGADETKIRQLIHELNIGKYVNMSGHYPNAIVTQKMRDSNIFIFTSDRAEGWGAVLNEAMSSGCAVVASNEIGAAPYLIQHQTNGLIFESKSLESLYENVASIINDKDTCEKYARNAYETMKNIWSPQNAAESFVSVCSALLDNKIFFKEYGPCSKAMVI